jgi:hypothetical protein
MPHVGMCGMGRVVPAAIALILGGALSTGFTNDPPWSKARHTLVLLAASDAGEVEEEVPVVEATEPEDSPAGDLDRGEAEAQMPSVPSEPRVEQPEVEAPVEPEQPAAQP